MAARVYSRPFIARKGLTTEVHVTVPAGHVYVVRAITGYAHTIVDTVNLAFKSFTDDAVLWYADWQPGERSSIYADCHLAFETGMVFGFSASTSSLSDGADVYCSGYDLLKP